MATTLFRMNADGHLTLSDGHPVRAAPGFTLNKHLHPADGEASCAVFELTLAPYGRVALPALEPELVGLLYVQEGTLAIRLADQLMTLGCGSMVMLPAQTSGTGWNPTAGLMRGLLFIAVRGDAQLFAMVGVGPAGWSSATASV